MKKKGVELNHNSIKLIFLFFLLIFVFATFSLVSFGADFAEIITGNFTINTTTQLNFTSNSTGVSGYIRYNSNANDNNTLEPINGAQMIFLGSDFFGSGEQDFIDNFKHVPFKNFSDFTGRTYSIDKRFVTLNEIFGIIIPNTSTASNSDEYFYGAFIITELNVGINITLRTKFNNRTGNNTFAALTGSCEIHGDFNSCLLDVENDCDWNDDTGSCSQFFGFSDIPHADCDMLPEVACNGINDTFCIWNPSLGTQGRCDFAEYLIKTTK